jgi:hypothetical protein
MMMPHPSGSSDSLDRINVAPKQTDPGWDVPQLKKHKSKKDNIETACPIAINHFFILNSGV